MMSLNEDALICDLAETYQIYDYKSLPLKTVATLAAGLRDDARIKMLAAGTKVSLDTLLLASISDRIELLLCSFGGAKPNSILAALTEEEKDSGIQSFSSGQEFESAIARLRGEI